MCSCVCVCLVWVRGCVRVPLSVPVNYICARASSGACSGTPVNRHTLTHRDHTRHTQSARGGQLSLLLAGSRGSARPAQSLRRKVVVRPQAGPTPMPVVRFSIPRLRTACRGAPTRPQRLGGQEEQGGGGVKDLRLARAAHAPSGEAGRFRICRPPTPCSTRLFPPLAPNLGIHKLLSRPDDQHSAEQCRRR